MIDAHSRIPLDDLLTNYYNVVDKVNTWKIKKWVTREGTLVTQIITSVLCFYGFLNGGGLPTQHTCYTVTMQNCS